MTHGNDGAFARTAFYHPDGGISHPQDGLTIREHFASMAMQGLLSNVETMEWEIDCIAKDAVNAADALIKALNETK